MLVAEEALQPEDRDVAEERKSVLECQPVVESMVGSPLILQELSKVCDVFFWIRALFLLLSHDIILKMKDGCHIRCTRVGRRCWQWTAYLWPSGRASVSVCWVLTVRGRPRRLKC